MTNVTYQKTKKKVLACGCMLCQCSLVSSPMDGLISGCTFQGLKLLWSLIIKNMTEKGFLLAQLEGEKTSWIILLLFYWSNPSS